MKRYNDTTFHLILKILRRKIYPMFFHSHRLTLPSCEDNIDIVNQWIYNFLIADAPCMIARLGAVELSNVSNYLYVKGGDKNIIRYIKGYKGEWWWNKNSIEQLKRCAGVWPAATYVVESFSQLIMDSCNYIDLLGSWIPEEQLLEKQLIRAKKVHLFALEPFFSSCPWTKALTGKNVLIIHPFTESINNQYVIRDKLFVNQEVLPEFNLITYKSVQSLNGNSDYKDWFEALHKMECDIEGLDFDIAILGCGAYGLPLAAHIKQLGRKAVHLGGATQLLFGIKGNRWEYPVSALEKYGHYPDLMNEYWVKPKLSERPQTAQDVENACYW